MPDDTTRWAVSVSKATDITVRSFLAQRRMKNRFVEVHRGSREMARPRSDDGRSPRQIRGHRSR
jgi:hypothetical protein